MNRKMIGEAIYIRVSDSHETWKCDDPRAGEANSMVSVYSTL